MDNVIDITERLPFNPERRTQFVIDHLRQVADELERGEYGQVDRCLIGIVNPQHTYMSRMSLENEDSYEVWKHLANAIYRAVTEKMFQ